MSDLDETATDGKGDPLRHFYEAFDHMDRAFASMDKAFQKPIKVGDAVTIDITVSRKWWEFWKPYSRTERRTYRVKSTTSRA